MSLSAELLRLLVVLQLLLVAALFAFLLLNRLFRDLVSRRRRWWTERVEDALRRWVSGRLGSAETARTLGRAPITSAREALETVWPNLLDEDRQRLRGLARESDWSVDLRRLAGSPLWWRRMDAAQIFAFVGTEADVDTVARLLEDRHMAVRVASTFAARDLTHPDLLDPLLREVVSADPPRRRALYDAILSFGTDVAPKVRRRLAEAEDGEVPRRTVLLTIAGRLADRGFAGGLLPEVLDHADHDHLEVRIRAVKALGAFRAEAAISRLRAALRDGSWEVRAQAARGLGRLEAVEARRDLRRALADENWWVRLRAGIALRQLGPAGVRELESVETEEDPYAHDMAVYVLRLEDAALTEYAA